MSRRTEDRRYPSSARPTRASCPPRRIWRRSSPTASGARSASTSPGTRAVRAPIRGCAARWASEPWPWTSARTSRASTSGPSPTPYERAEQLAAAAYGAGQTWFLTNGATQGNHALCLALAGPGQHVLVQRNSHASVVDGLVLSGGMASFVTPEYDEELGMAHGVTPEALEAALARNPGVEQRVHRLAHLLRDGGRRSGLCRGRPRRRRRAGRRLCLGLALRLSSGTCPNHRSAWAPTPS